MAAAVVHIEEEIIIRLNHSAYVLDVEMTAIRVARYQKKYLEINLHSSIYFCDLTSIFYPVSRY